MQWKVLSVVVVVFSRSWRPDATMAPQRGPVNFGPDLKISQIRIKIKILSFILCLTTVITYRTKPSSEMTAYQGPSNIHNITPNALPRDIRVRGSKPVNLHYRTQSMVHRPSTTHTQPPNTEKHHTQPRNNDDTNIQQIPSTKIHGKEPKYTNHLHSFTQMTPRHIPTTQRKLTKWIKHLGNSNSPKLFTSQKNLSWK
jgi:hypothetical protein